MSTSAPARVLHVIKGLGPGGAERLLVSLAEVADTTVATHQVAYLLPAKQHLVRELEAQGAPAHLIAGPRGIADPRWPLRLRRLARDVDIVHLHSPAVAAFARPVLRAMRDRPAIVSTEHNVWSAQTLPTRMANALTLPLDDVRLAVSQQVVASSWRPWRAKTSVIVNGIPVSRLHARRVDRAAARVEHGWHPDDVVVAIVANLRVQKDYPTMFAAAERALAAEPRLRFVAIGQGPLEASLRDQLARRGLGDRFTMLGYHPDPAAVLCGADLFALSSIDEGLSIALLEAMAVGLPPVVTAVGGITEVVTADRDGMLVPSSDPVALADALVHLARHPEERVALGNRAQERAEAFDMQHAARALETAYLAVLRRRGSAEPER